MPYRREIRWGRFSATGYGRFRPIVLAVLLASSQSGVGAQTPPAQSASGVEHPAAAGTIPQVTEQATFLYYKDLAAPREFYHELLGVAPYYEKEWVNLFHPTTGATIGLVKVGDAPANAADKRSVVMVSIVTRDVKSWYERISKHSHIHIVKPLYDHPAVPIRAFEMQDPGGYPVEVFEWRTGPR